MTPAVVKVRQGPRTPTCQIPTTDISLTIEAGVTPSNLSRAYLVPSYLSPLGGHHPGTVSPSPAHTHTHLDQTSFSFKCLPWASPEGVGTRLVCDFYSFIRSCNIVGIKYSRYTIRHVLDISQHYIEPTNINT